MLRSKELKYYNKHITFKTFITTTLTRCIYINTLSFIIRKLRLYLYVKRINFNTNICF